MSKSFCVSGEDIDTSVDTMNDIQYKQVPSHVSEPVYNIFL